MSATYTALYKEVGKRYNTKIRLIQKNFKKRQVKKKRKYNYKNIGLTEH